MQCENTSKHGSPVSKLPERRIRTYRHIIRPHSWHLCSSPEASRYNIVPVHEPSKTSSNIHECPNTRTNKGKPGYL